MSHRARLAFLAMMVAETLLVGLQFLDPWLDSIRSGRMLATFDGRPIAANAWFDFADRWDELAMSLGLLLLWISLWALPKRAWHLRPRLRTALLFGQVPALAAFGMVAYGVDVDRLGGPSAVLLNTAVMISFLAFTVWVLVHPMALALEARRRDQGSLFLAWTLVALAPLLVMALSTIGELLDTGAALAAAIVCAAILMAARLGVGIATAASWYARPAAPGSR